MQMLGKLPLKSNARESHWEAYCTHKYNSCYPTIKINI